MVVMANAAVSAEGKNFGPQPGGHHALARFTEPQRFEPTLKGNLARVDLRSWDEDWNGLGDEYDDDNDGSLVSTTE